MAGPITGVAFADRTDPVPSQQQVDRAKSAVAEKERSVKGMEAALNAAAARLESAVTQAEIAAEAYNGALWRLSEARKATDLALARSAQAAQDVEDQRSGIVTLVTESYQNGTELNTATALMSDEGPEGLMNRYAVVQSAGDSMQARYDRFRAASTIAKLYAEKAQKAQKRQLSMAKEAKQLRDSAGAAAASAGMAANQIAIQKEMLVQALAKAQNISVGLATRRQNGLERIARQKAAAAAKAKHLAAEAALKKAAQAAAKKAAAAKKDNRGDDAGDGRDGGSGSTPPPGAYPAPPIDSSPPGVSGGADRAIAYAKAQIGKKYVWGAAGPDSFDCSGLTMMAWRAGGKSLPHYSAAQFTMGTRISVAAAQAGDLFFWTSNGSPSGIHHVAIALGGGQFIEAPRTGVPVRYNSIYTWFPDYAVRL